MDAPTPVDWLRTRADFPTLGRKIYLNTCSLGALSTQVRAAVNRHLDLWEEYGAAAWYTIWLAECAALRAATERLFNAAPGSVALAPSVGVALSTIGSALDYTQRPKIITTALDFPTIPYQWLARPDVEVVMLPSDDGISVPLERYAAAIDERTALVATSHVFFASGTIQPAREIAALAHAKGALCLIDGYQAAGQIPVDVAADGVDFYLSGGLKWLLGGTGIVELYVRPELVAQLEPTVTGWFAHERQFAFDVANFSYAPDARRFEIGTPALAAVYAAHAGIQLILEHGVAAIRQRELQLVADLVGRLREIDCALTMVDDPQQHAGIVMIRTASHAQIVSELAAQNIIVDHRPGHVRVSPFFYNTEEEHAILVAQMLRYR